MTFNIKKYIVENNNRQKILTEAGSVHEKLLMQIISLVNKFPIIQTHRDVIFGILRKGLRNPVSRLGEAQVTGVKLSPEDQDWLMFILGPTSKRGPISREMAIKLIQKDIKDGGDPGEVAISKKLLKRIQRGVR